LEAGGEELKLRETMTEQGYRRELQASRVRLYISFLVDTHAVIKIELDRYEDNIAPTIDVYPVEDIIKGSSKTNQIKIAVALELARKDLAMR